MPRWPIRLKLMVGLGLVVGMMLILLGGSTFGLHSFHISNLTIGDQLREIGASTNLFAAVLRLHALRDGTTLDDKRDFTARLLEAREALRDYHRELNKNTTHGNRAVSGRDELVMALSMDEDLTAILDEIDPDHAPFDPLFPGTTVYADQLPKFRNTPGWKSRMDRLHETVGQLPGKLHLDLWAVLQMSKGQYQTSRIIVWSSAAMVLGMLCGLTYLFHRWVLSPVRLLQRGVRHVARGSFEYKINLKSGDEMQDLSEAFNDMTAKISMTYADLERQVQERSKQLVRSERLAGVGFLAAGVAHEINNPLASIAFCAEALDHRLARFLDDPGDPDLRLVANYLKMIQEEAFRCKSITEKLLDFSRCNDITRERTDLTGLIQGVVDMIQHIGKYRGKKVVFQPRDAVMAHVDCQEMKQVVLNLIVNALESMDHQGTLRIEARYAHGMAELSFADDGCGMEPDVLENIFEPFFTRRREGKGTGLGLSITHRIISQHDGEIMAVSPGPGRGSTFTVRLPINPTEINNERTGLPRSVPRRRAEPAQAT
jgi:two-component system, NtrC family, sensor kinase